MAPDSERRTMNIIAEIVDRHVCQPSLPDGEVRPCCIRATVTAMMRAARSAISSDADEALHYSWRWSRLSEPERDYILSFAPFADLPIEAWPAPEL
jgi:hypothetical protein